jgi:hypothetical protein
MWINGKNTFNAPRRGDQWSLSLAESASPGTHRQGRIHNQRHLSSPGAISSLAWDWESEAQQHGCIDGLLLLGVERVLLCAAREPRAESRLLRWRGRVR